MSHDQETPDAAGEAPASTPAPAPEAAPAPIPVVDALATETPSEVNVEAEPSAVASSDLNSVTTSSRRHDRGVFFFDTERGGARDSVNGLPPQSGGVDTGHDPFSFFHFDNDRDIHVFDEPPTVRVLGGRFEDAWPTRYVEYDVEVCLASFLAVRGDVCAWLQSSHGFSCTMHNSSSTKTSRGKWRSPSRPSRRSGCISNPART